MIANTSKKRMKKNASLFATDILSLEKIITLTREPCVVSNPVFATKAKAPLSGASLIKGFSGEVTCKQDVPPCNRAFLSSPSGWYKSVSSLSLIDSFKSGVDSPESMASLTMQDPSRSTKSQGMERSS
ncbi:hypothetical protein OGATHE_002396 [Ogataea polymorpha]|uniref:Uncharacterized protein n=1 Tax=Ogataea polymorpha TaxID=460523 RepID=A0A9P8PE31_9ASCO|nr:hypothetical protein OGATHE_002396 [Ogataea polymorpha]